jgi:hypothetical protein
MLAKIIIPPGTAPIVQKKKLHEKAKALETIIDSQ